MGGAIGQTLPLAVGIAMSPIPVIAVILMLLSARAKTNGTGFLIGWTVGVLAVVMLMTVISGSLQGEQRTSPAWADWLRVVLGLLLLWRGGGRWRSRGDAEGMPGWMTAIDGFRLRTAIGLGALLSAVNPKNLILGVAAGLAIGAADLGSGGQIGTVVVFTVIASATVAVPVVGYLVAGSRIQGRLDAAKAWLEVNHGAVMGVLVIVFGVVLIGNGIEGLAA